MFKTLCTNENYKIKALVVFELQHYRWILKSLFHLSYHFSKMKMYYLIKENINF